MYRKNYNAHKCKNTYLLQIQQYYFSFHSHKINLPYYAYINSFNYICSILYKYYSEVYQLQHIIANNLLFHH